MTLSTLGNDLADLLGFPEEGQAGSPARGRTRATRGREGDAPRESGPETHEDGPALPTGPLLAGGVSDRTLTAASHLLGAVTGSLLTAFVLQNTPALASAFGNGAPYVVGAAAIIVAIVGLVSPSIGSLVAFFALALSMLLVGHPLVGLIVAVAAFAWWFVAGREGAAAANTALCTPLAGCLWACTAAPFATGRLLRPLPAVVTCAFCAVVALVFASFGSSSLIGWDLFTITRFSSVDITRNMITMIVQPSTWATVAGWLVATAALSFSRTFEGRWSHVAGVAVAVTAVLVGSLVFASPTPALFIVVILAAAALLIA